MWDWLGSAFLMTHRPLPLLQVESANSLHLRASHHLVHMCVAGGRGTLSIPTRYSRGPAQVRDKQQQQVASTRCAPRVLQGTLRPESAD